ncbi:MAG: DNA mismatch repair protein MutS [Clostridia bacterium]|nr:DNA mismatch repair protein MutS [Clostridia bacterium]NLS85853.1 DNA mismatch repair protein MutS [Oscillospiraceae bacterium]
MAALSPMMQQYFEIKKKHPDKILFFRLGDFYEMFFDDARLASKELELTLTGRDCGQEERAPMCGVPFHAYEGYVAKLISKGYKVAICEQMEDPAAAKGIVKRDVIRVVTPGTVIESSMLKDDKNNYIASIYVTDKKAGVCFADISTGTAHTTCLTSSELEGEIISELCRYCPSEVLMNTNMLSFKQVTAYIKQQLACSVELLENSDYDLEKTKPVMCEQFGESCEQTTGLKQDNPAFAALGVLISYLNETQKKGVERLKSIHNYSEAQYMQLSPVTRANLELTETMRGREKKGTLLWVLDKTQTAMGKRLMRTWIEQPLVSVSAINARLDAVEELYSSSVTRSDIAQCLSKIFDVERLMTRTVYGSASPREIYSLAVTCEQLPQLKQLLQPFQSELIDEIRTMDELSDIRDMILTLIDENAPSLLKDGGIIKNGANAEVDELRDIAHGGREYLAALEAKLKDETNIRTLKIGYNRVFGYYIEVSRSFSDKVPPNFVRKQTLANAERYITDELKQLENKILGANERLVVLERQLFDELLQNISAELVRIQSTAQHIARLDVLTAFAEDASLNGYVKPIVDDSDKLFIDEGRHPVIEQMLKGALFVPNDVELDCGDNRMLIITGPNMAGKSTYMRQTALIALMAQIGSFVPAKSCEMGVVDAIFTRVGASDDLAAGQSTFMVEMTEVAEILEYATQKSLVILDEIGRGTSTFDGMSIARAVVEHIADKDKGMGCKTLFATHYHELTDLENALDGVKNYNIAVKKRGDDITFLRRIIRGPADDSYGIEVAKLAGLPDSVIKRAKEVLKVLEANAPNADKITQLDFANFEKFAETPVPSELVDKLNALDVETLTPIEALNFLYELKNTL